MQQTFNSTMYLTAGMCPGLGRWHLHDLKSCSKGSGMANKHAGVFLVLVGEFVVVVNLFEYWSVPTTVGTSLLCDYTVPLHYVLLVVLDMNFCMQVG